MKLLKPLTCAALIACVSTSAFSAPGHWGSSDSQFMKSAEAKIEAKNYPAAIDDLKGLVASDTNNADAYNLLGFTHRKLKRYEEAEQYYQRALTINPKHKGALEYMGELYVETDRLDKANQLLQRLDEVCYFGCKEYDTLKDKIEFGEKSAKR